MKRVVFTCLLVAALSGCESQAEKDAKFIRGAESCARAMGQQPPTTVNEARRVYAQRIEQLDRFVESRDPGGKQTRRELDDYNRQTESDQYRE